MGDTKQVLTRYPSQLLKELDKIVESGLYASRTDALRDAVRILIRMQLGVIKTEKSGLELQKEANKKYTDHYLKLAKGNWKKAKELMLKDLEKIKV